MALDEGVYHDDLDVTLTINGNEWRLIEAKVELSQYTTPDYVDFIAVPTPETANSLPTNLIATKDEGGILGSEFSLDVDNELVSERDVGNEETRIFTGNLANLSTAPRGAFEGTAYDPAHQKFSQNETQSSFYNSQIYLPLASGSEDYSVDIPGRLRISYDTRSFNIPSGTRIKASELVRFIVNEAGISDYELHLSSGGTQSGDSTIGREIELYFSDESPTVKEALDKAKTLTNSEWWFDRFGTFHFGALLPNEHVFKHSLSFITDSTDGLTTPPYQSVRIIGSGVVSEEGWSRAAMNEETPLLLEANISDKSASESLVEPTFTYRNMSITTQEQADAAREKILSKLKEQQAEGKVTVVGMPEVRPWDGIVMPNTTEQPMGGQTYGVRKVIHKLNSSDGFVTDIHVGGVTSIQEQVLSNEEINQASREFISTNAPYSTSYGGSTLVR